jgi:hypothetical protein
MIAETVEGGSMTPLPNPRSFPKGPGYRFFFAELFFAEAFFAVLFFLVEALAADFFAVLFFLVAFLAGMCHLLSAVALKTPCA